MMYQKYNEGWIEVITGCMFAGKTEELIRRINILKYAKKEILVVKPEIDNRYKKDEISSHDGNTHQSVLVKLSKEILNYINNKIEVVAIDEAQFLDKELVKVCETLANRGIRVMVAGLDRDFRGEPFGVMPELLVRSEFVTKLNAVCVKCGAPATRTQRLVNGSPADYNDPIVLVGARESYEARCRHCHEVKNNPNKYELNF